MAGSHDKDFVVTSFARNLIRLKARQLCSRGDFRATDASDLQQELWLAVLERIERFDPSKGPLESFITLVVNRAVSSLLRRRQRIKRDKGTFIQSLDETFRSEFDAHGTFADVVTDGDLARRIGRHRRDAEADHIIAATLAEAMAEMPEDLRDISQRLMFGTVHSVALELGLSRRALSRACADIREFLERAGLGNQ
jgi:RNA polymerase sigma factor (sigma-70 family)